MRLSDRLQHRDGALLHLAACDKQAAHGQGAEAQVLGDRQVLGESHLVLNYADAGRQRAPRILELNGAPVDEDLTRVRLLDAGEQLAQRALAGAVLAAQRVTRSALHVEADVLQRARPGKTFTDVAKADERKIGRCW